MKELLLRFVEKAGQKGEVELFWSTFQQLPRMKFAVIHVAYEVLRTDIETLAESIAMMNRVDIYPILVFRLQPMDYFASSSAQTKAKKGFDAVTLKRHFTLYSRRLKKEIHKKKGRVGVVDKAGYWSKTVQPRLRIDTARILSVMNQSKTAIINPLIERDGVVSVLDSERLARVLVKTIRPQKYILINEAGGILDEQCQVIPFLNVSHPKDWGIVKRDMRRQVRDIREFIASLKQCAVVVTSAEDLLQEIFTVKGKGTFIKHHVLKTTSNSEEFNQKKIANLLENAFQKKLTLRYFKQKFKAVVYQKEYEGVAIIQEVAGVAYLDKFAVGKLYEGTGLGKTLWQKICRQYPKLVWRANPSNSLNRFYLRECDGCMKFDTWHVYWRQLDWQDIRKVVPLVLNRKPSLIAEESLIEPS